MRIRNPGLAALLLWPLSGLAAQGHVERGRVEMIRVPSAALGVEKAIAVYLPASYDRSSFRFPVAYYLHGGGGNERTWIDRVALDSLADSLHREGLPEAILVMPDGDTGYWIDWEEPDGFWHRCMADPRRALLQEASATYCVSHGRYESYLVRDVVPFVDSAYRTRADHLHRGIAGLSMGGYGALFLAARHPDMFSAAVSHSGVVSPLYVGPHPYSGRAVFAALYRRSSSSGRPIAGRYSCSSSGATRAAGGRATPFGRSTACWRMGAQFLTSIWTWARWIGSPTRVARCRTRCGSGEWRTATGSGPGGHDDAYWRAHAAEGLAWLLQRIAR